MGVKCNLIYSLMQKSLTLLAATALLMLASSSASYTTYDTHTGDIAPLFTAQPAFEGQKTCDLGQMRGQNVLVTFWASTDASSREAVNAYDTVLKKMKGQGSQIAHISVNADTDPALFQAVVEHDGLDTQAQYHGATPIEEYRLDTRGFHSYLLDTEGRIIAVDPAPEALSSLI